MATNKNWAGWEDADLELDSETLVRPRAATKRKSKPTFVAPPDPTRAVLESDASPFTYQASRHERLWMLDALATYYADNVITDVIGKVKGGKEATVYCCAAHPSTGEKWLAAKIYRPRMFRSLRNDKMYREGRALLDENGKLLKDHAADRAIHRGSAYGKDLLHVSWLQHEVNALKVLHPAGVRVPKLFASGANVLLMEYIGDGAQAAQPLASAGLDDDEARDAFAALMADIWRMLKLNVIHADLSAYNVLYWRGRPVIIDFPQVVHPLQNKHAFKLFERDVQRICDYFARYDIDADAPMLARDMWQRGLGESARVLAEEVA